VNNSKELFILFRVSLIFTLSEIIRLQFEFREWRGVHYVKKSGSDLRHVVGFLRVLRFSQLIKLTETI
jgi:hypothetical protein